MLRDGLNCKARTINERSPSSPSLSATARVRVRQPLRIPAFESVRGVQVEEGTPFARWHDAGTLDLPEEDSAVRMFSDASTSLRAAGYEHYELSNYARKGHECRHNLVYWLGHSYYAFGVGAASFVDGRRFSRPRKLAGWHRYVDSIRGTGGSLEGTAMQRSDANANGETLSPPESPATSSGDGHSPDGVQRNQVASAAPSSNAMPDTSAAAQHACSGYVAGALEPALDGEDRMLESLMLMLRLRCGVDLHWFGATFGADKLSALLAALQPHVDAGRAEVLPLQAGPPAAECVSGVGGRGAEPGARAQQILQQDCGERAVLTDPEGLLLSNSVISDLFAALA